MCPLCGRSKGGLVCGYCGWVPEDNKYKFEQVNR